MTARSADARALAAYDSYLMAHDHRALRQAAEHAYEAVNAQMKADTTDATALYVIERELPGVRIVMHGAADKLASDTARRLRAVWGLLQLPAPSPVLDEDEREAVLRLLVATLASETVEVPDISARVTRIPHRRVANLLRGELSRSELPWKAALTAAEYGDLVHRYASRSGPGRGQLCTTFSRLGDSDHVTSMLTTWLDGGGRREMLYPCLDASLAASVPAVLV